MSKLLENDVAPRRRIRTVESLSGRKTLLVYNFDVFLRRNKAGEPTETFSIDAVQKALTLADRVVVLEDRNTNIEPLMALWNTQVVPAIPNQELAVVVVRGIGSARDGLEAAYEALRNLGVNFKARPLWTSDRRVTVGRISRIIQDPNVTFVTTENQVEAGIPIDKEQTFADIANKRKRTGWV